ncbi:aldolase [Moorella thermoacetica]|uniref:Ribulose-5-phosphate 4-epimerase and related epimerases and aldolases n=2 Tax=Neomoorella thermoacetica TaxID=1525 RepID=A0A0S6U8Q2_NEOTH|nr:class II aldolase/adducin family protein [Moorella thermoacetica]AKX95123.1 methylthioribulose-1-phosphate dehydratase [Moorella thermoacetica]AKX97748.1 methylthioribulose-1-phosphate dehydratase [Moorella thermoacetica]OIQ10684.1 methylthioribulose-1-phosphate dehydratase [Moorella thermoacetica]OIQ56579.1 methylthioribulose-1-phosphate dehydratase [Moorella thermoacetica]QDA01568.1 Methylthioribulose-1-phosphate dehydratase [Moorella thermoacetica]
MTDLDAITGLQQELVAVSRQIFARNLTSATSGNISARVPGHPEQVLIKATGKSFGDVEPEDFVLVDLEGNILAGLGKPSKEIRFHLGIMKARPEVGAVFHGHSAYATAYVTARGDLPVVTAAAEGNLGKIGIIGFAPAGSVELAEMVNRAFKDPELKAAVMTRHGFITVGPDVHRAFYLADVLEDNARVAFLMAQLG